MLSSALWVKGGGSMNNLFNFILAVAVQVVGDFLYKWLDNEINKRDDNQPLKKDESAARLFLVP